MSQAVFVSGVNANVQYEQTKFDESTPVRLEMHSTTNPLFVRINGLPSRPVRRTKGACRASSSKKSGQKLNQPASESLARKAQLEKRSVGIVQTFQLTWHSAGNQQQTHIFFLITCMYIEACAHVLQEATGMATKHETWVRGSWPKHKLHAVEGDAVKGYYIFA